MVVKVLCFVRVHTTSLRGQVLLNVGMGPSGYHGNKTSRRILIVKGMLDIIETRISFCFPLPDNSIQSVITFDQGGEWVHLRKPENAKCDSTAKNKEKVCLMYCQKWLAKNVLSLLSILYRENPEKGSHNS